MPIQKSRRVTIYAILLGAAVIGVGSWAPEALAQSGADGPSRSSPRPADRSHPSPGRMFVDGRVLDPDGKPVPRARVLIHAATRQAERISVFEARMPAPIGRAPTDAAGRFQIEMERLSSARHHQVGAIAMAPGLGAGWVNLDPDAERPDAEIRLGPEQVIQGRLVDPAGRPGDPLGKALARPEKKRPPIPTRTGQPAG